MNIFFKISLLTAFVCFLFAAQAQSKLDTNNGFMELTFDDTVDTWRKDLVLIGPETKGDTSFLYEGKCCRSGYGFEFSTIELTFTSQGNLKTITLATMPYDVQPGVSGRAKMLSSLIQQYGAHEAPDPSDDGLFWFGETVSLSLDETYVGDQKACYVRFQKW